MKQFVSVEAKFDTDGNLLPLCICWEDGRKFEIDRITDIRYAASLKSGGTGLRYTCRIRNQMRYLFLDDNRWFIEVPQKQ
ncbi:MAG: hypothetical protein PUD24_04125 [Oscillospiraceae bacterium]|nr:hypothetical protein [Oscillospiraceae bacterium]